MYAKNTKRFMVIFQKWSDRIFNQEVEEFDKLSETDDYIKLINEVYCNENETDRFGNKIYIGYVVLDFLKEKVLKWGKEEKLYKIGKINGSEMVKDFFFRRDDEIPKDYKWDDGEYEGWLRFRWGDGKNAVGYKKNKPKAKIEVSDIQNIPIEIDEQEVFDKQIEKEKLKRIENRW